MNKKLVKFGVLGIIIIAVTLLFWRPVYENYVARTYEKPTFVPYTQQNLFTSEIDSGLSDQPEGI